LQAMLDSFDKRQIVVSCPEWGPKSEEEEKNGNFEVNVMDKCRALAERGVIKIGFDFAGSTTADDSEDEANKWAEAFKFTFCSKEQWGAIRATKWFYGYQVAVKKALSLECQAAAASANDDVVEALCIRGGPITRLEHFSMDRIIKEAQKDNKKQKIECNIRPRYMSYYEFEKLFVEELHSIAGDERSVTLEDLSSHNFDTPWVPDWAVWPEPEKGICRATTHRTIEQDSLEEVDLHTVDESLRSPSRNGTPPASSDGRHGIQVIQSSA